jgi:mycothiol synthase
LIRKVYAGVDDLRRMQGLVADSIQLAGDCGYMHVGDIPHRIYNGNRRQPNPDPAAYIQLWENESGMLLGFSILYPQRKDFDFQVHAKHRGGELESNIVSEAITQILQMMQQYNIEGDALAIDIFEGDTPRIEAAEKIGFVQDELTFYLTGLSLDEPIADIVLPEGFTIRSAAGIHEAEALGKVHSSAFNSGWTPEAYQTVMQSPGFVIENELVVVTPTGDFAAFTINWFDDLNKTALFEPVGVHEDYQRQGLGRALMTYALHRMKARGIETAFVAHEADNPASTGLYAAMGFREEYRILSYKKSLQ